MHFRRPVGLERLIIFLSGADVVEVAPAYDHGAFRVMLLSYEQTADTLTADITNIAAADIAQDFMAMMLTAQPPKSRDERKPWKDEL